jgi:hypothetical protein
LLVGLFMVAQFAGVVSSPRASALPVTATLVSHSQDHHAQNHYAQDHLKQDHAGQGTPHDHHHDGSGLADTCCGLHACFAGVLPLLAAAASECVIGEPIDAVADDLTLGLPGGRLDRPPRPLH